MRLLLLLIIAGVAAYFTNPTRAVHEARAREAIQAYTPGPTIRDNAVTLDDAVDFVTGMVAGQTGRYETFLVFSKYTLDMPGPAYAECFGAFTIVRCNVVEPAA